ncbi:ubiquitin carboxyl-terminal hydrolase 43a isoform X2 [Scleropages formosus]|uniref:ubiquitinyl hydrolase 1 n=1 Tax=Scleropages formosus TaxID=113540 RepID=A0A8C9RAY8_SCLFO|nr:ubiquitin carboxyl-terminal hydrolase 43 isoform X2 [Scleropages formosus]
MDNQRQDKEKKAMRSKSTIRKEKQRPGKLLRRRSLRSVGTFMSKVLRTLGSLAHLGDAGAGDAEDDDGGFRDSAPCTLGANSAGNPKGEGLGGQVRREKKEEEEKRSALPAAAAGSTVKERLSWCYGDKTPGVLGLKNHGNTCFMNAVVQCLSNTDLLAEYLGLERYKSDLVSRSRLNGLLLRSDEATAALGGEVTQQLAALIRALWTLEYTPQLSVDFKSVVAKYGSQFRGNSQHDALEFLLWLLDRMHEDVSSSPNSHSSKTKASGKGQAGTEGTHGTGPPSAQQPRGRHSFVQEHFQAQYRSSLTCPHCLKQSNTFDPFLCISLPIPLRQTRPLCVTLVFNAKNQRYLRIGLAVPLFGTVAILREMVAEEGKISPDQVILTEVYATGFQRSFFDEEDLTSIAESDVIYAFQAPPLYGRGGAARISGYHHSLPSSPYFSGPEGQRLSPSGTLSSEFLNHSSSAKLLLLVCNVSGTGQQAARFGPPFLMREDRTVSWDQLQQSILSKIYYLMVDTAHTQNSERALFKVRVVGGSASYSYLSHQDGRPLCHPAVDRALKFCNPGGPPHVKLLVEWEPRIKECLFGNIQEEVVKDSESVRAQQQQHLQQHSCTLDECFQLYTKEEQLAPDDAWKCPHCQQLQQGTVKMSLWTLPDILILHLKRFRQSGERRHKLSTLVRFPLANLDMAPHMVKRSQSMRNLGPWPPATGAPLDFLYDLYAVCNHHGGMHGGHYTAYCRNSVDGQWYSYDDSAVDMVPEDEVCTRGAYILFYQRRNAIPPWSASSSVRGSTSSSMSDHWLIRLTGDSKRGSLVSRVSSTCPSLPDSPEPPVFDELSKEERGGFETRPFVRGVPGRSVSMRTPTKTKENLSKVLPLRWSFGSRDRQKQTTGELVEYLESGRRPRCTKDSIVSLMAGPSEKNATEVRGQQQRVSSPSGSSLNCLGRPSWESQDSLRVPQGQSRAEGQRRSSRQRDDGTLTRRSSRKSKQEQGSTPEPQSRKSSGTGIPPGPGTGLGWEATMKRVKSVQGGAPGGQSEESKGKKGSDLSSHDGILAFLKSSFTKKDSQKKVRESEPSHGSSSRLSLSNGALSGPVDSKANGAPRGSSRHGDEMANGKVSRIGNTDIKRSQSSSNIQNKAEPSLRRSASLHKSGLSGAAPQRSLTSDRNATFGTLQRTRYSTNSLGRKRMVPESSF